MHTKCESGFRKVPMHQVQYTNRQGTKLSENLDLSKLQTLKLYTTKLQL